MIIQISYIEAEQSDNEIVCNMPNPKIVSSFLLLKIVTIIKHSRKL